MNATSPVARGSTLARSGPVWSIATAPHFPHEDLERLAREIWRVACPWGPWPEGWCVRFGALTDQHASLAAVTLFAPTKLVIIDERKLVGHQDVEGDLRESLVHSLAHVAGTARVALTNALENVKQAGRGLLKSREAALAELAQRRHGGQRKLVAQYERALAQETREFLAKLAENSR